MIKNIIFDFGGVIYDIDHTKTKDAFVKLGLKDFDTLYGHAIQSKLFEDFEIGKISPDNFREEIRSYISSNISDNQIDEAWNALLLGFNLKRLDLLEKVNEQYRIFLLSNTNQIHFLKYMDELNHMNRLESFKKLFEKLFFSHQIGMRKPDHKIFYYALSESHIKPEETVFIDDYDLNIIAANKCGLKGIHLKPNQNISDLFDQNGFLIAF